MMNKEVALKEVLYWLSHLSTSARLGGKIHFFDLNVVAEDFYAELLNIIYDWNLVNLNHTNLNSVAVDLGDVNMKVAVQVTSDRTKLKIQKTLDKFESHKLSKDFTVLKVVIIGPKTGNYPGLKLPPSIAFDGGKDVFDDSDLLKEISKLSTTKIQDVVDLMKKDIIPKTDVESSLKHSDSEALETYRNYFDRPALKDDWLAESEYSSFKNALTDLISLLNTGIIKNQSVTKSRFQIDGDSIKNDLAPIAEQLRCLRQLFNCHVRSGDINIDANSNNFKVNDKSDVFNNLKTSIIKELNVLLNANAIKPIV